MPSPTPTIKIKRAGKKCIPVELKSKDIKKAKLCQMKLRLKFFGISRTVAMEVGSWSVTTHLPKNIFFGMIKKESIFITSITEV